MISRNNCSPPSNKNDPCSAVLPYCNYGTTKNQLVKRSRASSSTKCYRPLQQLYKTVQSPLHGNSSSRINFACVCRPSERYKTTNMTYGSFHYNNWSFMQKNRPVNYDARQFTRCYNNNKQQQKNNRSKCNDLLTDASNLKERQRTSDACCPTNCCNNTTSNIPNC